MAHNASAQNVGIGTATPTEKLHVVGGARIEFLSGVGYRLVQADATGVLSNIADGSSGQMLTTNGSGTYSFQTPAVAASAWELLGNAGTINGTNFLGTTDAQDLDIRTNNVIRHRFTQQGQIEFLNTGYSVFIGEGAGASDSLSNNYNVFVGYQAGNANTTGSYNTANGNGALTTNTTGGYNTANGTGALYSNTTGSSNTANGGRALFYNTTADFNTANGYWALYSNSTGTYNTANGGNALYANTTGDRNTANGYQTLLNNNTGSYNTANGTFALYSNIAGSNATAIGYGAMYYANNTATPFTNYNVAVGYQALRGSTTAANNTGNNNTALGYQTLYANISGDYNTALGHQAGDNITSGNQNIMIGYNVDAPSATGSNQLSIGNMIYATGVDGTGTSVSSGNVGIRNNSPSFVLDVIGDRIRIQVNATSKSMNVRTDGANLDLTAQGAPLWIQAETNQDVIINQETSGTISTGYVGIGTSGPTEKLHVQGGTRITSLAGTNNRLVQADATGVLSDISDGSSGQVLTTNGAGVLSFQTPTVAASAWELLGNASTLAGTNFLGTTDAQDLVFKTNDTENMRINTSGNIDVGAGYDDARIYARVMSTDAVTNYGLYVYHDGAVAGTTYGTRTINYSSTNSTKYGIYNYTNSEGTGARYGIYNYTYLNSASNSSAYGIRNYVSVYGSATQYGMYNYLTSSAATGTQYGQATYVYLATANTSNAYGEYIFMDYSSGVRYGEYKNLNSNATYDGTIYGDYNRIYGSGDGVAYGDYNRIEVTGTGTKYGGYNSITGAGTGTKYGSYNNISPTGSGTQYAVYNNISATNTSSKYGVYNNFADVNGTKYGVYNYFPNGAATGTIYGVRNWINNDGNATKYGIYNNVSGGDGALRGSFNTITPATTNSSIIYGVYSSVSSNGTGTHYGVYSTTPGGTNDYSGMFYAGNFVANEIGGDYDFRVESDTRTHAFWIDADENLVRFGTNSVTSDGSNGNVIDGVTVDYVADFDNGAAEGTAIGIGSIEFLLDGQNKTTINNVFAPSTDNIRDLGTPTLRWDDVYATNGTIVTSDKREKESISELQYGLKELMLLRPVTFKWNKKTIGATVLEEDKKELKLGLIAQEVQQVLPEVVQTHNWEPISEQRPDEFHLVPMRRLGMSYHEITPVIIKSIQEQQGQIETLRSTIYGTFKNISDFGIASLSEIETFVPFNSAFKNLLTGTPVVAVTPINSSASLTIVSQTTEGFVIRINGEFVAADFNWVAMAKIKDGALEVEKDYTRAERQEMLRKVKTENASIDYGAEHEEAALRLLEDEKENAARAAQEEAAKAASIDQDMEDAKMEAERKQNQSAEAADREQQKKDEKATNAARIDSENSQQPAPEEEKEIVDPMKVENSKPQK
jgi:hypothetical protein